MLPVDPVYPKSLGLFPLLSPGFLPELCGVENATAAGGTWRNFWRRRRKGEGNEKKDEKEKIVRKRKNEKRRRILPCVDEMLPMCTRLTVGLTLSHTVKTTRTQEN